jgi:taurine dioxygenase
VEDKRHEDTRLVYTFKYERGTADRWHIGGTWRSPAFHIESLTYQVVPEVGGHTLWADLQAAYDGLSEPVKRLLESVSAVYSAYPGDGTADRPPVTEAESQALLPFPQAHASSPNYTVSFGWKPGDFVLWDNLATWHYAVNDYDGPRRYRKVIAG